MTFWRVLKVLTLTCVVGLFGDHSWASALEALKDNFDGPQLSEIWNDKAASKSRVSFKTSVGAGNRALALSVKESDFDSDCECQRTEIREAENVQPDFGSDLWYRFKLRLSDLSGGFDTSRWMLGAWKQEVEGSPFLALRFEGGVFYITLESSQSRVMLASSLIDARAFIQVMKGGQGERFGFVTDKELYIGDSSVQLKHGTAVYLPDPRLEWVDLMVRVKGGLDGDGVIEIYVNQQFVVRATGKIGVDSPSGSKTYLRLGHRREKTKTNATLLIDDYRRGPSRDSVVD